MRERERPQSTKPGRTIHLRFVGREALTHQHFFTPGHRLKAQTAQVHDHTRPGVFGINCPPILSHDITGRTRKGRLRSPRVANNVVRFFSAFFIIGKNRPFCTRTTPALFFPHRPSGNTFVHSSLKNYSITGFKEGTQCLYLNIPQESPTMPVLTLSTQSKTGWMILIGMPWCQTIRAVQFKEEQLRRFDRCLAGEGKPHQLIPLYRYILRRHLRIDRSRNI